MTVLLELWTGRLLRRLGVRGVLVGALFLVTLGSSLYLMGSSSVPVMLAAAALRGMGFGMSLVVTGLLIAVAAPDTRRGEAVGYYGLASALPGVVAPSLGLRLFSTVGFPVVFVLAAAAGLFGAASALPVRRSLPGSARPTVRIRSALRERHLLVPFVTLGLTTSTYGGLMTFAPLTLSAAGLGSGVVFFFVFGVTRTFSRWLAGLTGDRIGAHRVVVVGLVPAFIGAATLAISQQPAAVVVGALLYGLGFGAVLNGTYVWMLEQLPRAQYGLASTLWNFGFDGAVAVSSLLLGLLATGGGYRAVFWTLPLPLAGALLVAAGTRGGTATDPRAGSVLG
jgi:MFS family permease